MSSEGHGSSEPERRRGAFQSAFDGREMWKNNMSRLFWENVARARVTNSAGPRTPSDGAPCSTDNLILNSEFFIFFALLLRAAAITDTMFCVDVPPIYSLLPLTS